MDFVDIFDVVAVVPVLVLVVFVNVADFDVAETVVGFISDVFVVTARDRIIFVFLLPCPPNIKASTIVLVSAIVVVVFVGICQSILKKIFHKRSIYFNKPKRNTVNEIKLN